MVDAIRPTAPTARGKLRTRTRGEQRPQATEGHADDNPEKERHLPLANEQSDGAEDKEAKSKEDNESAEMDKEGKDSEVLESQSPSKEMLDRRKHDRRLQSENRGAYDQRGRRDRRKNDGGSIDIDV